MVDAVRAAKEGRVKIWEKWTPEMEALDSLEGDVEGLGLEGGGGAGAGASSGARKGGEVLEVLVTEVSHPSSSSSGGLFPSSPPLS